MLKPTLIIFSLLLASISFGQKTDNEIFEDSKGKWEVPLPKFTKIKYYKTFEHMLDAHIDSNLTIFTDSAYGVKAMQGGEVILVSEIDSSIYFVTVKYGYYYLTYSNLKSFFVKKGDIIKKNASIGIVGKNLDGIYCLDVLLAKRDKNICPKNWINWKTK